jgi:pSer/pThr/pTyr-binding forkhead associated (FHA) protein
MGAKLLVRERHDGPEQVLVMSSDEVWVGRGAECALRVDDVLVSRKHAVLRRAPDGYVIEDLLSANGTYVNEQRITTPKPLAPDDVIRCGSVVVRVVVDPPEAKVSDEVVKERDALREELERQRVAIAQGRAYKNENEIFKRRVEELATQLADVEELRVNEKHSAEDLRAELERTQGELVKASEALVGARETVEARNRRVMQADAEIAKLKDDAEKLRTEIGEMARIKDAGWAQVNAAVGEAEQLREVIRQQAARMEELKVQVMVLEASRKR